MKLVSKILLLVFVSFLYFYLQVPYNFLMVYPTIVILNYWIFSEMIKNNRRNANIFMAISILSFLTIQMSVIDKYKVIFDDMSYIISVVLAINIGLLPFMYLRARKLRVYISKKDTTQKEKDKLVLINKIIKTSFNILLILAAVLLLYSILF